MAESHPFGVPYQRLPVRERLLNRAPEGRENVIIREDEQPRAVDEWAGEFVKDLGEPLVIFHVPVLRLIVTRRAGAVLVRERPRVVDDRDVRGVVLEVRDGVERIRLLDYRLIGHFYLSSHILSWLFVSASNASPTAPAARFRIS